MSTKGVAFRLRHPDRRLVHAEYIKVVIPLALLPQRRAALLVPHAIGKCQDCGSTLVPEPLPHRCDPAARHESHDLWRNERNAL